MQKKSFVAWLMLIGFAILPGALAHGAESIWIEAEHLKGIRGSCFPDMDQKSQGAWGMSGPGICPEWTQGGESEWLSIACAPDDDKAEASCEFDVPETGDWRLWVRYRDWREQTELFRVRLEQKGKPQELTFGEKTVVDENDELKLLWKWAFGWDLRTVKLEKGPAKLALLAAVKQPGHRQVDVFCLTTDTTYRPYYREKPGHPTWKTLDEICLSAVSAQAGADPQVSPKPLAARAGNFSVAPAWKLKTFQEQGFLYLWNVGDHWLQDLASQDPKRILVPYYTDAPLTNAFHQAFGGKTDVPIFGDPRIVPAFYGAGPTILNNPHATNWLQANPKRFWANLMNYAPTQAMDDAAKANWPKFKDRYVGNISGENLGYFDVNPQFNERLKTAKNRAEVLNLLTEFYMAGNAAKQKAIFGQPFDRHYEYTIPCQSAGMTAFCHLCREWGARTVGYENQAVAPSLAMRWAFLRGSARQYGGLTATYRSCNFGDAATIFSEQAMYPGVRYVYDNSYDVWAGAGMTWYKFDIWHQYLSGSSMFYHEQGFDEFWTPGGGSTAPKPIQLSPKGRLVDQFLKITQKHPDRGVPFTPIAFLLDYAHGWDPTAYQPSYFELDAALNEPALKFGDLHGRMLKEWFKVAYHPYGPKEAEINTGVNQIYIPGIFGNIFDVLVTSPTKTDALDSYPVVILNGQVALTDAWGKKLADYLAGGGTLVASAGQLDGPGVAALKLPKLGNTTESNKFVWIPSNKEIASQRFRYQPISEGDPLAKVANGDAIAVALNRGKGRLIFLSIPLGLGLDSAATPLVALTLAGLRQGLLPLDVQGEVEWLLNRTDQGWIVTLLNPAGANKPQHGVVPTDYAQRRVVKIRSGRPPAGSGQTWKKATEWFDETVLNVAQDKGQSVVEITVPAGGVRIVELE